MLQAALYEVILIERYVGASGTPLILLIVADNALFCLVPLTRFCEAKSLPVSPASTRPKGGPSQHSNKLVREANTISPIQTGAFSL